MASNSWTSRRNIPNILTSGRALAVPLVVWFLVQEGRHDGHEYTLYAAVTFFLASWTDYIDGHLARRWNVVSRFGKLVDPLADKLLVLSALIMLSGLGRIEAWVVVVVLAREFAVNTLRMLAASEGVVMPADQGGKAKTMAQMAGVFFLLLHIPLLGVRFDLIGRSLVYISALIAWVSGAQYFVRYFHSEVPVDSA